MNIKDLALKKYYELNKEEFNILEETLSKFKLSSEQENRIYLKFLFDHTIQEALTI